MKRLKINWLVVAEADCATCHGHGWICEVHQKAWTAFVQEVRSDGTSCPIPDCSGPGEPCPDCAGGQLAVFVATGETHNA